MRGFKRVKQHLMMAHQHFALSVVFRSNNGNKINHRQGPSKEIDELDVWKFSWKKGDFLSLGEEGKSY